MFVTRHFTIFDWLGWKNVNTCLVSYFNAHGAGKQRNLGRMSRERT